MRYEFAGFTLDDELFELRFVGAVVPVQRRVFDTMAFLIAHRDRVVTKDELLAGPWEGVAVTDAALDRAIMLARRALEIGGAGAQMIRTVRGRGYIWLCPVRLVGGGDAPPSEDLTARGQTPSASRFVGRAAELATLQRHWASCLQGQGGAVLIEGAAGVGKTRLVEQAAAIASRDQATVLWGHSWEGGGAPALWPWIQVLRSYLDSHAGEWRAAGRGESVDTLAALLPELRPAGEQRDAPVEAPQTRFRIFDALTQFFRGAAQMRPLLVVLEDVHAADDSTLLLLEFLARFVVDIRLLVLVTYREAHFPEVPLLSSIASGKHSNLPKLHVGGLAEHELRLMLETIVENPPAAFISELYRSTEGNPFLSEQFARLAVAEQPDNAANVAAALLRFRMPDRIAAAIRRQLEALAPDTRSLLEAAAVAGREFDVTLLSEIAGLPMRTTIERLAPAFSAALVRERGEIGRYSFSHALVRETIYRDLAPASRNELHRRAAVSLEQLYEGAEDLVLPQLAHHYLQAASTVDTERCIAYASRAAERALDVSAYELAAEHYATAINALDLQGPKPERRVRLLLSLGHAQRLSGRSEEAVATYDRAGELGASRRAGELVAEAALGVAETRREGVMVDPSVAPRLERALDMLEPSDARLRARLLGHLAIATYHTRPLSERLRMSGEALAMARRLGDRSSLIAALHARHWTVYQTTHGFHALELVDEMASLTREANDPEAIMEAKLWRIADLLGIGEAAAMKGELGEYAALAQRYAHPLHSYWTTLLRATEATLRADYPRANALAKQALDLGFSVHELNSRGLFATQALSISLETDAGASVEPMVSAILEAMPWFTPWRTSMALICALTDRRGEAAKELHALALEEFATIPEDAHTMGSLANLARVAALLGDVPKAESLYRRLLPFRGRNIVIATAAACWGPANYYLGLLAACFGDDDQARQHLESAGAESLRIGAFAIAARIDFAYGHLLAKTAGRGTEGRDLVERARGFAEQTGMTTLGREIQGALSCAGMAKN